MLGRRLAAGGLAIAALACTAPGPGREPKADHAIGQTGDIRLAETTQPTLSGHLVGIANIWKREVADAQGVVAVRTVAVLAISTGAGSDEVRHQNVFAGSVVALGADRYLVVDVGEGTSSPGWITVRKLAD